jgi:hypothetical protein
MGAKRGFHGGAPEWLLRASFTEQTPVRKRHYGWNRGALKSAILVGREASSEDLMKTAILIAIAFVTLACLPAAAQPSVPPSAQRPCLRFDSIFNWKALDNKTLIVEDNFHKKFRVGLMGYCEGLQFKERVAFHTAPVHLTCLRSGDDVIVRQLGTDSFNRCPITTITPENAAPAAIPQ